MFDVGNTPLVEFTKIKGAENLSCRIFGKLECENPAGSTKDRIVKQILDDAKASGALHEGDEIVDATSGNTGIALAAYGSLLGYKVKIFMPDNMSKQRISLMEKYGAEVVLTPAAQNVDGSIKAMNDYASTHENCFKCDQFNNKLNPKAHNTSTAVEIWNQSEGNVDVFIAGVGTGGTLLGVGNYLKDKNKDIKLIGVLPDEHPHVIQGIGDGFDPPFYKSNNFVDEVVKVKNDDALKYFAWINSEEGFSAGISSGANLCAAIEIAKKYPEVNNIVIMCADGADRY